MEWAIHNCVFYLYPSFENENNYNNFVMLYNEFKNYKNDETKDDIKDDEKAINNISLKYLSDYKDLDTLAIISINLILSDFELNPYSRQKQKYLNFYYIVKMFLNNLIGKESELNQLNKLFEFYNNNKIADEMVDTKFENVDQNLYEILFYGFRYCVQSFNKDTFYSTFFKKECISILKQNYIPGNNSLDDLHLKELPNIEKHFLTYPSKKHCFVCSCGKYYKIGHYGFPRSDDDSIKCSNCQEIIGFEEKKEGQIYGLQQRPGHYIIFKNKEEKANLMSKYKLSEEMLQNKTLEDYIKDIIEPILKKEEKGLSIFNKDLFESKNKIRKMSEIGYRLLNFILYSHIFFGNCFDFINNKDLEQYCIINNIPDIIQNNWNLLKKALKEESIENIEIFMNQIFPYLSELINKQKAFNSLEERNKFEDDVENIIKVCIKNYRNYRKKYIYENYEKSNLKEEKFKVIINELAPYEKYTDPKYPLYKYFMLTNYPTISNFKLELMKIDKYYYKYPLLTQLLFFEKTNEDKLKYLFEFNELSNFLIDNYSLKISREAAKDTIYGISREEEDILKQKKEKFKTIINQLNEDNLYYKDYKKLKKREYIADDKLIYFLIDNYETNFGMYIAAAYESFINWQNGFLELIADSITQKGKSNFYSNNILNKIPVQNAKQKHILSLNDINLVNIIIQYSKRDIFSDNGTIDYLKYNFFNYDFDLIENELGKVILSGKCLFEEDNLNFFTFKYENNSKIFSDFYKNYPQKELSPDEKKALDNYYDGNNISNDDNNNIFKGFFDTLLFLFFYLNDNIFDEEERFKDVLNKIDNNKIPEDDIKYFNNVELKVNTFMSIFFYIENKYLNAQKFDKLINDDMKKNFKGLIKENEKLNNKIKKYKNKEDLINAIKRYVFRYIIDNKNMNKEQIKMKNLIPELGKPDLWELNKIKIDEIKNSLNDTFGDLNLRVEQILTFYDALLKIS